MRTERSIGGWRAVAGLTLVEVLTVIAVLMLLAGLLLPGLIQSRRRADAAHCLSNFRQVTLAWTLYAQEHDDRMPNNIDGLFGGAINWVAGNMTEPDERKDTALLTDGRRSLLARYLQGPTVFKCPADEGDGVRSISMNCRLNPTREVGVPARWVGGLGAKYETFRRWSQIGRPADVFVLIDENPASINDAYFAVDMSNTGEPDGTGTSVPYFIIDYPASHHSKGATVSFADGHVEVKKWTERTTLGPVQPRSHTSPTDRDVRWLQEHSTYLK